MCSLFVSFTFHTPATINLLYVQRLYVDNDVFLEFYSHSFFVKDQVTRNALFQGNGEDGLYRLNGLTIPSFVNSSSSDWFPAVHACVSSILLGVWYDILGHPSHDVVQHVVTNCQLSTSDKDFSFFTHFQVAKSHK